MSVKDNPECPYCKSVDTVKRGIRDIISTGEKTQRYKCNDCKKLYSKKIISNVGPLPRNR